MLKSPLLKARKKLEIHQKESNSRYEHLVNYFTCACWNRIICRLLERQMAARNGRAQEKLQALAIDVVEDGVGDSLGRIYSGTAP